MKSTSIPRFLLPQGGYFALRRVAHLPPSASWKLQQCLNASTDASPSKPRVLEKPTKFNPPSHSQRLVKRRMPRQYPGPPLSDGQIKEQTTKKYPNMGPPEGTFMHWFLNSPLLHMCITLVPDPFSCSLSHVYLVDLLYRLCSFPSLSLCSLKISINQLRSSTCYPQDGNSGLIHSSFLEPTDMSTGSIQTLSLPKLRKGGRKRSMMCKNAVATGKLMAWRMSRDSEVGLLRPTINYWVPQFQARQVQPMLQRQMMTTLRLQIPSPKDGRSRGGWVFGNETASTNQPMLQ